MDEVKVKKEYWYSFYTVSCPVCGSERTDKQREYSKKPSDYWERHELKEYYDWCNE